MRNAPVSTGVSAQTGSKKTPGVIGYHFHPLLTPGKGFIIMFYPQWPSPIKSEIPHHSRGFFGFGYGEGLNLSPIHVQTRKASSGIAAHNISGLRACVSHPGARFIRIFTYVSRPEARVARIFTCVSRPEARFIRICLVLKLILHAFNDGFAKLRCGGLKGMCLDLSAPRDQMANHPFFTCIG